MAFGLSASCGDEVQGGDDPSGTYYADTDGDGYGDSASSQILDAPLAGWVLDSTDCDDTAPAINPGVAVETCGDGQDNDCDDYTDCADEVDCAADIWCVTCVDSDDDGYMTIDVSCPGSDDCDDVDVFINPGAVEVCDGSDNDCSGAADDGNVCGMDSGGVPGAGYPGWQERTLLVLTNAVRMDPQGWRDNYYPYSISLPDGSGILMPATYSAVIPLTYHNGLNQGARYHSEDMRDNCGLQHDSCDGTLWSTRIWSYYPSANGIGENAAYGFTSPLDTLNQFLCDRVGNACAADGTPESGHRVNIMRSEWKEAGMGFATTYWWTQDFAYASGAPAEVPALVAGSHVMTGTTLTYFANYHAPGDTAQGVDLMLGGSPVAMSLDLGTADNGTWSVTAAVASSCQSYYFTAVDSAGLVWRYPGEGEFRTYGIGTCTQDYQGP